MILVVGDIHGEFRYLNSLINKRQPSMILQVGDLGYWPKNKRNQKIKNKNTKIYFCDGNHEDHESLRKLKNNEVFKNIFYMKRGSILDLPNGRTVLFMGGSYSFDWKLRTLGIDWFRDMELLTWDDVVNTPDTIIDIVISHTAPEEFFMMFNPKEDPSRKHLSYILKKYKPKEWYFGHFHYYRSGFDCNCKWIGLAYPGSGYKWYVSL